MMRTVFSAMPVDEGSHVNTEWLVFVTARALVASPRLVEDPMLPASWIGHGTTAHCRATEPV